MNNKSIEQFYQIVSNNQDLQKKLELTTDLESFADLAVNLGQDYGYHFTAHEVKIAIAHKQSQVYELSDEQLSAVAGGKDDGGNSNDDVAWTPTDFHTATEPAPGDNSSWCQPDTGLGSCGVQNEPDGGESSGGGGLSWG